MNYITISSELFKLFENNYPNINIKCESMGNVLIVKIISPKELIFVTINQTPYEISILDKILDQEYYVNKEVDIIPSVCNIMEKNKTMLNDINES